MVLPNRSTPPPPKKKAGDPNPRATGKDIRLDSIFAKFWG